MKCNKAKLNLEKNARRFGPLNEPAFDLELSCAQMISQVLDKSLGRIWIGPKRLH